MSKLEERKTGKFRSLTVTLAVAFLALSTAVLLIYCSFDLYRSFLDQQKAIAAQQKFIAKEAAVTVKEYLQNKINILIAAVSIGHLIDASPENRKLALDRLLGLDPSFCQLALLNVQGEELVGSSRFSRSMSSRLIKPNRIKMFASADPKKSYISSVYIDENSFEPMVTMAVPATNALGDLKGALRAEVNLKFMWDLVGRMKVGKNGLAYVVNKKGDLIAFSDSSRLLKGENLAKLGEVAEYISGKPLHAGIKPHVSKGILGGYVMADFVPLGEPDWAVVVELPVTEAYENVIMQIKFSAAVLFTSFILAITAGIYLSRNITKPIISLRNAVKNFGEGRLNAQIEIESNDEIGDLARSFNQMIRDLKLTTTSVDNLNIEVGERKKMENELRVYAKKAEDSNTALVNMMQDMKETQTQMQELYKREQEHLKDVEEANRKKTEFVSDVSHELRTPLASIKGFVSTIRSDKEMDGKTKEDFMQIVEDETDRLTRLIEELLDMSRIEAGRLKLNPKPVHLFDLIIKNIEGIQGQAKAKDVVIEQKVPQDIPHVHADEDKTAQIIINLLSNAIKYNKKGGKIMVLAKEEDGYVKVEVEDTGIGMSDKDLPHMFEKFYRADRSSADAPGPGLWLALTKSLVEVQGGKMNVESVLDKGSKFSFTLPKEANK